MLKSTYKPGPVLPLPAGWTEHKAPTGHTYYYNTSTGQSTYVRPMDATTSYLQHQSVPGINLSDPNVANAFMAQYNVPAPTTNPNPRRDQGPRRPPPQPRDKPKSKVPIPDNEPWLLVYTKYGRRFAYHPVKNQSYWRIPEKLLPAVVELDKKRILEKANPKAVAENPDGQETKEDIGPETRPVDPTPQQEDKGYDSSEYEEVEVTDDEDDADLEGGPRKRQRIGEPDDHEEEDQAPLEFTEEDIAAQLAAMESAYNDDEGMDPDQPYDSGDEGLPLSEDDVRALFKDLLTDHAINPYSSWEKIIEEGKILDDARYTVLPNMKARREVWDEWSRERIVLLREQRAKEEKTDPRLPYMAFLAEKGTPKLYWPEFKRKYRKEGVMRDRGLSDKEREKLYRDFVARMKMPSETLKKDLRTLLGSVPLKELNRATTLEHLPTRLVVDVRFISLDPKVRDPIVEAYIQGLPPPPEEGEATGEEDEQTKKAREERERRERALRERERAVAEEKRKKEKKLAFERANLREGERELERAMQFGKKGLQSQLDAAREYIPFTAEEQ